MKVSKTFTIEYNWFHPGSLVEPASSRCPLDPGIYKVIRCVQPRYYGDTCVAFIEGRTTGISTEYLREIE